MKATRNGHNDVVCELLIAGAIVNEKNIVSALLTL